MSSPQADNGYYRTGEVVALLGVSEHVLRYWEKTLPLVLPLHSFGRRHYNAADIALLCRVRHLVRDQGLNLEAALERLLAERSDGRSEYAARLQEARAGLIDAFFALRRVGAVASRKTASSPPDPLSIRDAAITGARSGKHTASQNVRLADQPAPGRQLELPLDQT